MTGITHNATSVEFQPPGTATDMDAIPHQLDAWAAWMKIVMDFGRRTAQKDLGKPSAPNAFSATAPAGAQQAVISWNGFPKTIADQFDGDERYQRAETLAGDPSGQFRPQDEYLEWHSTLDEHGKIVAVDFTCEGPEYWQALAEGYPYDIDPSQNPGLPPATGEHQVLLALYQQYVSGDVELADLLIDGKYNPLNKWNTTAGAMHLTQPNNSLVAEIILAAKASVLREKGGHVLTDSQELIKCAQYGEASRSSDPNIGAAVNAAVRAGDQVSLRNPVGLYIDSLDTAGWARPDGSDVDPSWWKVLRGTPEMILRARYEVPAELGFTVGDLTIGGESIRFAGQIAEGITMKLFALAAPGFHPAPAVGCESQSPNIESEFSTHLATEGFAGPGQLHFLSTRRA